MDTDDQISNHILDTTLDIKDKFPELSKYIDEMPITIPDSTDPEVNIASLSEYENSLLELVKKYATSHNSLRK